MSETLNGHCACGASRFTARPHETADVCHCGICRRWSGGMFIGVQLEGAAEFAADAPLGVWRSSDWGERVFCQTCGSSLVWRTQDGEHQVASVQCFDDPGRFALESEIFIDKKPASYALAGKLNAMTGAEFMAMYASQNEG